MAGDAFLDGPANCFQGLGAVVLQDALEPRDSKFFTSGVRCFEQAIGVEGEDVARIRAKLGICKISGRKNSQGHVGAIPLRNAVGAGGKMKDGGMARQADAESGSILRKKTKCDEHVRPFEGIEDFVEAREKVAAAGAGAEEHASRAFDHAHDDSGRDAVARDIGDVGDPVVFRAGEIDQVAADFAAGRRAAVELEIAELRVDRGDEHAVDLGGEFDLRLGAEIAPALGDGDVEEAAVAEKYGRDCGNAVEVQAAMQPGKFGRIEVRRLWMVRECAGEDIHQEKMNGKKRQACFPEMPAKGETGDGIRDSECAGDENVERQLERRLAPQIREVGDKRNVAEDEEDSQQEKKGGGSRGGLREKVGFAHREFGATANRTIVTGEEWSGGARAAGANSDMRIELKWR